ncbi:GtrA family protein [Dysgonomonas sp. Marseille-P4677]|uniref:GtrA family protein n=1 Tax=Dysgonomonas sp. Marseille-P4677 TaxID=2364790 RepID=UPI0019125B81|nr:GtrA family protein [Dysgonomonas sp. Marseille-P4677]MBK5719380.1 GtrA family protein [Dysgonomonas sp. Marseille-P4677]
MADWIKKITKTISEKGGIFMFLRAQFSSQISSLTDFTVTILLTNIFGIFYGNATLFGNISGGIVNCIINYKWTFKAQDSKIQYVAIKYLMVWIVNLFLNREGTVLVTELVMDWIPMESLPDIIVNNIFLVPKIIVSLIVGFGWNYNMQRLFVYKNRNYRKYFMRNNTESSDKDDNDIEDNQKHIGNL